VIFRKILRRKRYSLGRFKLRIAAKKAVCLAFRSGRYLPITDLFGNIVKLVNPDSKKVLESYEYTSFGQESKETLIGNPWRYRGLRTDSVTKLVQCTFRDYSPELQHFLTADPTGYSDGPNLYGYARSNPIAFCDLNGLETMYGPCMCHGLDCEYYTSGKCGHGASITIVDDVPPARNVKVKEWFDYEEHVARQLANQGYKWPVNYSQSLDLQREELPDIGIGFINGVGNSPLEALNSATYVSNIAGGINVHLTYAATNGLIPDNIQAAYNLLGYYATNATKLLYDSWMEYFDTAGPDATYLQVCHSWGAIHVRNALLMCNKKMRKRIYVIAVAPGGYTDKNICGDVVHYINEDSFRDLVPRFDQFGLHMALSQGTVKKVKSLPNEPYFNHSFQSPTYISPLKKSIKKYLKRGKLR